MMLNLDKTKTMIINYTDNYKFTTNLHLSDKNIEVVSKTKLLGVILTNDLKWSANTNYLVKISQSEVADAPFSSLGCV